LELSSGKNHQAFSDLLKEKSIGLDTKNDKRDNLELATKKVQSKGFRIGM